MVQENRGGSLHSDRLLFHLDLFRLAMKEYYLNLGFEIDGLLNLTGKQAVQCLSESAVLVDVREDFEIAIKDFGLFNKLFCPYTEFDKLAATLPRTMPLIIADCVGIHSKEAAKKLLALGFPKVANLAGGIAEWERDGLPMKRTSESMSGQCPCIMVSKKKDE